MPAAANTDIIGAVAVAYSHPDRRSFSSRLSRYTLSAIEAGARSEAQLARDRQAFRELMAWRTDMLPVYDQAIRRHDLPRTAARIHASIDRRGRRHSSRKGAEVRHRAPVQMGPMPSEAAAMLEEMLGGGDEH